MSQQLTRLLAGYKSGKKYVRGVHRHVGVELEHVYRWDLDKKLVPLGLMPLRWIADEARPLVVLTSPEFTALQLEQKTLPLLSPEQAVEMLLANHGTLKDLMLRHHVALTTEEWLYDEHVPMVVTEGYERCDRFFEKYPERKAPMMRCTALQVSVEVDSIEMAIAVHDALVALCHEWKYDADIVNPDRFENYDQVIFPDWIPEPFGSVDGMLVHAIRHDYLDDPSFNHAAVRIHHLHPVVEFRLPGATIDPDKMFRIISRVVEIRDQMAQRVVLARAA